jgi:deoxyribose-phosphate aldolase
MHDIARYIDQTILKSDATRDDIDAFVREVTTYAFYCAVVNPCWVGIVRAQLPPSIKVCSVVGFPLGGSATKAKICATRDLVASGCDEIDMVMNIGRFLSTDYYYVGQEIADIVAAADGRIVKVIIETCLLTDQQKRVASQIICEKKAHFVKTSTGFSKSGAVIDDVQLLRKAVGPDFGVKASGGIRDYQFALALLQAGANRLGTSAGVAIKHQSMQSA